MGIFFIMEVQVDVAAIVHMGCPTRKLPDCKEVSFTWQRICCDREARDPSTGMKRPTQKHSQVLTCHLITLLREFGIMGTKDVFREELSQYLYIPMIIHH